LDVSYINVANNLHSLAMASLDSGDVVDAFRYIEMAITSSMMVNCRSKLQFRIVPSAYMPAPVASYDHMVAVLTPGEVVLYADTNFITRPLFTYERFPVTGDLLGRLAALLPAGAPPLYLHLDLGDGYDIGDYRRVAFSSGRADSVLVPDPYVYFNDNYDAYRRQVAHAPSWEQRQDVVFWRGGSGGPQVKPPNPQDPMDWSSTQRLALCAAVRGSRHRSKLDVALVHLRTLKEDYLAQAITAAGFLQPEVNKDTFLNYRYQIDIDGWTNSWSLLDKLISGATILKVESAFGNRQWFYDKLRPWENYIPIRPDLSDFEAVMDWLVAHPQECRRIAAAGAETAAGINLSQDMPAAVERMVGLLKPL